MPTTNYLHTFVDELMQEVGDHMYALPKHAATLAVARTPSVSDILHSTELTHLHEHQQPGDPLCACRLTSDTFDDTYKIPASCAKSSPTLRPVTPKHQAHQALESVMNRKEDFKT